MSAFKNTYRTLIMGGLLFLLPLVIIIILLIKAIHIFRPIVHSLVSVLGIETIFGKATISVLSIVFLILLCFISGALIHAGLLKKWNSNFEETLYLLFPPLQRLKFRFFSEDEDSENTWRSILWKREECFYIAFITYRSEDGYLSIFIPNAPEISNGEVMIVHESKCKYKFIPRKEAMKVLLKFGKGLSAKEYKQFEKI